MMAGRHSRRAAFWKWTCVAAAILLAFVILMTLEPSFLRSVLMAFLLACPAIAIWGAFRSMRPLPVPLGPAPATLGLTLNWMAPWYDLWAGLIGFGRRFRNRVFSLAAPHQGEHVLDVGCGTGWFTRRAAAAVGPSGIACGIDPAPDMIRIAMQTGAPHGARFELGVIEDLPYDDARFDLVVASMVIHHLPPDLKEIGLREILRVLKPGGRVLLAEPRRSGNIALRIALWPFGLHGNLRDHLRGRMADLLRDAGFVDVTERGQCGPFVGFWTARKS
jgi:SAM-dependent methyltransferase